MNTTLKTYLNAKQYNVICKYWRLIEKYKSKIENFDYSNYSCYEEFTDDEETIAECVEHNNRISKRYEKLEGRLNYYEQEYENYVNNIGYKFNDQTQNEHLFNLLNNGILLDN
jgi:hypothetical protein